MAVAADALFVANGLGKGLAQGDADVFHRVVGVDVQIAHGADVEVDQAMAADLVQHVLQKRHTGGKVAAPFAVQVDRDGNLGFQSVACNVSLTHEIP